jgi:hypothetical protein
MFHPQNAAWTSLLRDRLIDGGIHFRQLLGTELRPTHA